MFRGAVRDGDWKLVLRATLPMQSALYNLATDPGETRDVAAQHPDIVALLESRINGLAGEMAPSKFFEETFQGYLGREEGTPLLPNEEGFFNAHD